MSEWVDSGGVSVRRIGGREIAVVRGLGGRWGPGNHASLDEAKSAAEEALAAYLLDGLRELGRLPDVATIERERDAALAEVEQLNRERWEALHVISAARIAIDVAESYGSEPVPRGVKRALGLLKVEP